MTMPKSAEPPEPLPAKTPGVGGAEAGLRNQEWVKMRPTQPLALEAQGCAGAGSKWPGGS